MSTNHTSSYISISDKLFVLVEYVRHGSLLDNLTKQRIEPEEANELELNYVNRLNIALDVAKGMSYLAMKRVMIFHSDDDDNFKKNDLYEAE